MKLLLQNDKNRIGSSGINANELKWSVWNDRIDVDENKTVVFNTFLRNAVLMDVSEIKEPGKLDESRLNTLFQLGILVASDKDEKKEWEMQFLKGKEDLSYIDLTILLTQNCQMQCVYCFEGAKGKSRISRSTMNDILLFLESRAVTCKRLRVTWFGGEPLLAYDRLKELSVVMMNFCEDHCIEYSADITTNGFALNRRRCDELISCLNVRRYIITVDGPEDIHEQRRPLVSRKPSFPVIWRNIEMLTEMGAWVTMRMTIDKNNVSHIPALLDRIAGSKLNRRIGLAFCRTVDYNYAPDGISESLYSETEFADVEWRLIRYAHRLGLWKYRFPSAAPSGGCLRKGDIVIGVGGEIYKCLDTVGNMQWITGHIGVQDDAAEPIPEWYGLWNKWSPLKDAVCKECVLVPLCNGGCPHNALFADKKHGTQSGCPDWKANYQRQIKSLIAENYDSEII